MVEINESERKNEKWIKRNEDNLRDLQENIKHPNIWIIEEDKKKDHEKILEEIIVENFLKMGKEIITQVQELMLLNCGVREHSWEYLGLQGDQTSPS